MNVEVWRARAQLVTVRGCRKAYVAMGQGRPIPEMAFMPQPDNRSGRERRGPGFRETRTALRWKSGRGGPQSGALSIKAGRAYDKTAPTGSRF